MRIGIDFDNTLAIYDSAFADAAHRAGLVPAGYKGAKTDIKKLCLAQLNGEEIWMRLQGRVYGFHIGEAFLAEGADHFLKKCREKRAQVFIVSHKTRTGHFDPDQIDHHQVALSWMESQGFFDRLGLQKASVSFHPTRAGKIARIAELDLDHFIDDLEEVFLDQAFPAKTRRHLYRRLENSSSRLAHNSPSPLGGRLGGESARKLCEESACSRKTSTVTPPLTPPQGEGDFGTHFFHHWDQLTEKLF